MRTALTFAAGMWCGAFALTFWVVSGEMAERRRYTRNETGWGRSR